MVHFAPDLNHNHIIAIPKAAVMSPTHHVGQIARHNVLIGQIAVLMEQRLQLYFN